MYACTTWLYLVRPLGGRWAQALLGTSLFRPDAILNAAILEWGWVALGHFPLRFLDWPAGYPLTNSLAGTENLLGWQIVYAPLRALGVGNVAAYNTLLVGSIVLSGLTTALLARRLGLNRPAALVGGFAFAFGPFHVSQLVHIQTMSVAWAPLALVFLDRVLAAGRARDAVGLGLTVLVTLASGLYIGIFLACVLGAYAVASFLAGRHALRRETALTAVAAVVAALIVLSPVLLVYVQFARQSGYAHPTAGIVGEALADLVRPAAWQAIWSGVAARGLSGSFLTAAFPGVVATALAIYAVYANRRAAAARQMLRISAIVIAVTLLLSLGPTLKLTDERALQVGGFEIPAPGAVFVLVSAIRYPMRIALFATLFGALVSGLGVHLLSRQRPAWIGVGCGVATVALLLIEFRPQPELAAASMTLPAPAAVSGIVARSDSGPLVELPWTDEAGAGDATFMALDVYAATAHERRTVAYYGGVRPTEIDHLQRAAAALPDEASRQDLVGAGVTTLVVRTAWLSATTASDLVARLDAAGYRRVAASPDALVYALD